MPTVMGSQLNKALQVVLTPGEVAAGINFLGVNLDATYGEGYLIDGINFSVLFFAPADFANIFQIVLHVSQNISLNPGIPIGAQLAQAEQLFVKAGDQQVQRGIERLFIPAFPLQKGGKYSIHGDFAVSPGLTNNVILNFTATGRPITEGGFPLQLR